MNLNNNLVELQVLNKIIIDQDFGDFKDKLLPNYFNYPYDKMYQYMTDQYKQYNKIPSAVDMAAEFDEEWETVIVDTPVDKLIDDMLERAVYKAGVRDFIPQLQDSLNMFADGNSVQGINSLKDVLEKCISTADSINANQQRYTDVIHYNVFKKPDDFGFLPTGFPELDMDCGGIANSGELCLILARTGEGKSWVLCQTAVASFMIGKNVGIITVEMSTEEIIMRLHTIMGHFSNSALMRYEIERPEEYYNQLKKHDNKFLVFNMTDLYGNLTIETIEGLIENHNLDIVLIDGISYIKNNSMNKEMLRTVLARISADLITLSQKKRVPIVCSVQSNREGVSNDGTPPGVNNIAESDGIALAATKILSMGRNGNRTKIQVVKSRLTERGTVYVYDWDYDTGNMKFIEKYVSGVNSERTAGTRERQEVENKQPLKRQDHDWQKQPNRMSVARPKII